MQLGCHEKIRSLVKKKKKKKKEVHAVKSFEFPHLSFFSHPHHDASAPQQLPADDAVGHDIARAVRAVHVRHVELPAAAAVILRQVPGPFILFYFIPYSFYLFYIFASVPWFKFSRGVYT
jgi:hypothetical protein